MSSIMSSNNQVSSSSFKSSSSTSSSTVVSLSSPPSPASSSPTSQLTQFTTLIQTEKRVLLHNERETNVGFSEVCPSINPHEFEYDEVECDQEIDRITNQDEEYNAAPATDVQVTQSPEPSGNHELVALVHDPIDTLEQEHGGAVEFEEFIMGEDEQLTNINTTDECCVTSSSSKSTKSSKIAAVQQQSSFQTSASSLTQQSSVEVVKQNLVVEEQTNIIDSVTQQQQSLENGTAGTTTKKSKVERKPSKSGGKKSKSSNAEISKENISVTLTNGTASSSSTTTAAQDNLLRDTKKGSQQCTLTPATGTPLIPEDLVKKLGPGESRVFAKVCVANLRRSFGDLTVINSSNASNDLLSHNNNNNKKYSNSLEYNNRVVSSRELKYNLKNAHHHHMGPSSLPSYNSCSYLVSNSNTRSFYGNMMMMTSSTSNCINSNKLQLFQPAYWEGLFSFSNDNLNANKKSSFSKFDSLVSKNNKNSSSSNVEGKEATEAEASASAKQESKKMYCASCEKQVFQMELIRAEKKDWHKNCFRCVTCRKVLSVDTYQSHEQRLYCKPHFKELFQPKAVVDNGESSSVDQDHEHTHNTKKSKLQLIICESQPKELPPDVVRASDTPSTGLEDIQIDVRSKFEMFEGLKEKTSGSKSPVLDNVPVKRSASVLAKLKKYESSLTGAAELNGVSDEDLNGVEGIELQSDEEGVDDDESNSVIKDEIKRKLKNPLQALNEIAHFKQMDQVRSKWEEGTFTRDQSDSRKEELQKFRSRLCQGKSGQLKELYEKGVDSSEGGTSAARQAEIEELKSERARVFREMFEKGEIIRVDDDDEEELEAADKQKGKGVDLEVFEAGVARESKKIFEEMDKRIASEQQQQIIQKSATRVVNKIKPPGAFVQSAVASSVAAEIVRSSDIKDEPIQVNTAELSNKFKFFETYEDELARKKREDRKDTFKRITPPREEGVVKTEKDYEDSTDSQETYRDPTVVRHGEVQEDDTLHKSKTASKMLSVFRQMEENLSKGEGNKDPIIRPLKQFTPPRETVGPGTRVLNDSEEEEDEDEEEEEDEEDEEQENQQDRVMGEDEFLKEVGSLARARSLRAKFERWEQQENERNKQQGALVQEELAESIESAKNLKAKFEAMRLMESSTTTTTSSAIGGSNKENKRSPVPIRVNRFVLSSEGSPDLVSGSSASTSPSLPLQYSAANNNGFNSLPADSNHHNHHNNNNNNNRSSPVLIMSSGNEQCAMCEKRVYAMEKIEAGGKMYHKNCFRCSQCKCILRMDTFTSNKGTLFCTTHFKQLFKIKGNYDEGFGHETQYQVWAKKQAATTQQN